jgi:hypothetical protein
MSDAHMPMAAQSDVYCMWVAGHNHHIGGRCLQLLKLVGTSYGPSFAPAGATYLRPSEHGLAGLLSRHLFCSEAQWRRYMDAGKTRQVAPGLSPCPTSTAQRQDDAQLLFVK